MAVPKDLNVQRLATRAREARFKLGWMIVPADGTGRCQLDEAETSVRRHFFCSLDKSPTCP